MQHGNFSHLLAGDEITTRGKVVQPLQSVKSDISAVLTVMRDLDPHIISWFWIWVMVMVRVLLVQEVLDGDGLWMVTFGWMVVGWFGLHSLNNFLIFLSTNIFSLLVFTQI